MELFNNLSGDPFQVIYLEILLELLQIFLQLRLQKCLYGLFICLLDIYVGYICLYGFLQTFF